VFDVAVHLGLDLRCHTGTDGGTEQTRVGDMQLLDTGRGLSQQVVEGVAVDRSGVQQSGAGR
jgi:hypothetical protein